MSVQMSLTQHYADLMLTLAVDFSDELPPVPLSVTLISAANNFELKA